MDIENYRESIYTILAGISGGIINMYIGNDGSNKTSIFRLLMALVFGLSGALFLAPIASEYLELSDRAEHGVTFLVSVLTELILMTFINVFTVLMRNPAFIISAIFKMGLISIDANKKREEKSTDSTKSGDKK